MIALHSCVVRFSECQYGKGCTLPLHMALLIILVLIRAVFMCVLYCLWCTWGVSSALLMKPFVYTFTVFKNMHVYQQDMCLYHVCAHIHLPCDCSFSSVKKKMLFQLFALFKSLQDNRSVEHCHNSFMQFVIARCHCLLVAFRNMALQRFMSLIRI